MRAGSQSFRGLLLLRKGKKEREKRKEEKEKKMDEGAGACLSCIILGLSCRKK